MMALCECGMEKQQIHKKFPMYSSATIYRHTKKGLGAEVIINKRKSYPGRPPKLTDRDIRKILRAIPQLREREGSFSSKRVAIHAGLENKVSNRSIRRVLNNNGYGYRVTRKKGLMTATDRKRRTRFCRSMIKRGDDFWTKNVAVYIDGTGFQFKTRPLDQARAPRAREWRLRSEGLKITAKGQKEGVRNANFMVGISYRRGVVLIDQYTGSITGAKFASIVDNKLRKAIGACRRRQKERVVLQDGCPRQNSKLALDAFTRANSRLLKIPARSPDLNPIENFFNVVKKKLKQDVIAKNIESETFQEFSNRVRAILLEYPVEEIDKIIDSMPKRLIDIVKRGGYRSKY